MSDLSKKIKELTELNKSLEAAQEIRQLKRKLERLSALLQTACNRLGLADADELNSPAPFPPPLTEENNFNAEQLAAELTEEQRQIWEAHEHHMQQLGAQDFDEHNYKFWIR